MTEAEARRIVQARSGGRCEVCGGGRGSEMSHRRTRAVKDEHEFHPCNLLNTCSLCHRRMHANPEKARERGHHVSRFSAEPAESPVLLLGNWWLLHCDGSATFLRRARGPL